MTATNRISEQRNSRVLPTLFIFVGVLVVIGLAKADGPTGVKSAATPSAPAELGEQAEKGRVLYKAMCSTCHAKDGQATRARRSTPAIPDFTSADWHLKRTDAQLTASIRNGLGDDMPAFDDRLNPQQSRDLLAYLRAFGPAKAKAKSVEVATGDFDSRLRQLQVRYEELGKQRQELSRVQEKP